MLCAPLFSSYTPCPSAFILSQAYCHSWRLRCCKSTSTSSRPPRRHARASSPFHPSHLSLLRHPFPGLLSLVEAEAYCHSWRLRCCKSTSTSSRPPRRHARASSPYHPSHLSLLRHPFPGLLSLVEAEAYCHSWRLRCCKRTSASSRPPRRHARASSPYHPSHLSLLRHPFPGLLSLVEAEAYCHSWRLRCCKRTSASSRPPRRHARASSPFHPSHLSLLRHPFPGLLSLVEAEVLQEHEQSPSRPLFLVGESFGALLAAAVAARNPSLPITLVLINSATSFPRSSLQPLIPLLKSVPSEAYSALPFLFSLAIVNPIRIASGGLPLDASLLDRVEKLRDNLLGLIPSLPLLTELLPQATLEWKLHLLETGSAFTEPLLSSIRAPTLIIAGSDDQLLPSKEEAARLQEILTTAKARTVVRVFEGSGHALLLESGLDLASTIKGAHMYIQRRGDDPVVSGFQPPTVQELARAKSGLDGFLRRFCSPVFLSTVLEESPSNAIAASESSSNGGRHNGAANKEASNGAASNGAANNGAVSNGAAINRASGNGAAVSDSQNGNASSRSSSSSSSISTEQHQKQQKQQQEQRQRQRVVVGLEGAFETSQKQPRFKKQQQKQQQEQRQRQRVVVGLEGLPACERPLLFVGNHQTLAPEMSVLVSELMAHGVVVRGLAHPLAIEMFHDINLLVEQGEQYKVFGAVPVTPANTYKVLANKEAALLFPGGVREALKKRGEDYQLFWPERAEFVRMAAKHEATIIPFACIGVDDGFDILVDADEMPSVPVIGPMAVEGVQAWPRVRDAAAAGAAAEQFIPPVVVPKGLNRLYFLFGAPIRTK
ncbi:unnamed protein product, partial [Closterium sp. Naga37s-1]